MGPESSFLNDNMIFLYAHWCFFFRGENDAAARMIDGNVRGDISLPSEVMSQRLMVRYFDDVVTILRRA